MPQPHDPPATDAAAVRARLDEVVRLLDHADAVSPELRRDLLAVTDELRRALDAGTMPTAEVARLAYGTAHLAESLRRRHEEGILARARDRLEEAVLAAEARAPVVSGLIHRLLETLANIGI